MTQKKPFGYFASIFQEISHKFCLTRNYRRALSMDPSDEAREWIKRAEDEIRRLQGGHNSGNVPPSAFTSPSSSSLPRNGNTGTFQIELNTNQKEYSKLLDTTWSNSYPTFMWIIEGHLQYCR